jgi:hypothetical protein
MRNRTRMIAAAAAVTAALAAGGTATALASTTGAKPSAHTTATPASDRCAPDNDLAARLGVPAARLDQALRAVKTALSMAGAGPTQDQFDAALARRLGIPQARVRQAFAAEKPCYSKPAGGKPAHFEPAGQPGSEALAAAVARELHVATARVNAALRPLFAAGRADPSSPVFATAARSLGVSAQQLSAALADAKQSLAGGR